MIRTGLIGFGLAGSAFHAPLIDAVDSLVLTAIGSSRRDEIAHCWPEARVASADAVIADPDIDLIVVATPNTTHAPLARAAIMAGKHVVIDKPLALDAAEGAALADLAADRGRVLGVFHNRRWDGDFLTVRRLLDQRVLGDVRLYEARWDRLRTAIKPGWREQPGPGSGLLADLGPHLIDQALVLFGMPEAITADIVAQRAAARVDDYFELRFDYGPMRAILSASTLVAAPRPRFAVSGTGGSFVKYGLDPQETWMRDGRRPIDPGYGMDAPDAFGTLTNADGTTIRVATESGDYRHFYAGIVRAIRDGAPPPVAPADAVATLRLIECARRSAIEGRRITIA
ncbi:oxidoreductase [Hephaestia sp. GCM10023244]|uniref:oxidoreductase n=1 Tax=unclassified Hephaestia TaxID=2631281 RepID=UPI00207753BB|nr:oxidoreductase [Hephaestia sp. MAHUQ-44]MCM8730527.1 oxidoreductase [Hephaestia sp. MAHUQ-44]